MRNDDNSSYVSSAGAVYVASGDYVDAIIRRRGDNVTLQFNGYEDFTGSCAGKLTGLKEWCVGNGLGAKSDVSPAEQQFSGYIHRLLVVSGDLMVPNDL